MYLSFFLPRCESLRLRLSASKLSSPDTHPSPPLLASTRQKAAAASPVSSPSQGLQIPSDLQGHKTRRLLLLLSCFNQPRQLKQLFYNSPSMCSCTRLPQSILVAYCTGSYTFTHTWAICGQWRGTLPRNAISPSSRLLPSHNFSLLLIVADS